MSFLTNVDIKKLLGRDIVIEPFDKADFTRPQLTKPLCIYGFEAILRFQHVWLPSGGGRQKSIEFKGLETRIL